MEKINWRFSRVLFALLFAPLFSEVKAAEFSVKDAETAPPEAIAQPIRAVLDPKPIQLLQDGKPLLELWLRREVPLKRNSAKLDALAETTLVGAVAVRGALRDYKDNEIPAGVYTARFILQPQDGDHLGTAEFNYFLALVGTDVDKEVNGLDKFGAVTKASGKLTPSGHPAIISLRPVSGGPANAPEITAPTPEHRAIRCTLNAKGPGGEKVALPLELVFEGHGHIQ